jgi:hypothetical protein
MATTKIIDRANKIIEIVGDPKAKLKDFDRITMEIENFSHTNLKIKWRDKQTWKNNTLH